MSTVEEFGVSTEPGRGAIDIFGACRPEIRTPPPVAGRFLRGNLRPRRALKFCDGNCTLRGECGGGGRRRSEKGGVGAEVVSKLAATQDDTARTEHGRNDEERERQERDLQPKLVCISRA